MPHIDVAPARALTPQRVRRMGVKYRALSFPKKLIDGAAALGSVWPYTRTGSLNAYPNTTDFWLTLSSPDLVRIKYSLQHRADGLHYRRTSATYYGYAVRLAFPGYDGRTMIASMVLPVECIGIIRPKWMDPFV